MKVKWMDERTKDNYVETKENQHLIDMRPGILRETVDSKIW